MSTERKHAAPANPASPASSANPLGELMPAREWVKRHGGAVFHSYDSFEWFMRQHREEFAQCPDWVETGRGKFCGPGLAAFVRELLQQETRKKQAREREAAAGVEVTPRRRGRPRKVA